MLLVLFCYLCNRIKPVEMNRVSDFLNFDTCLRKGNELLKGDKNFIIGFYIILSVNTGLRVSDVLRFKHCDLINKKENDIIIVHEKKTGKARQLTLNKHIVKSYTYLEKRLKESGSFNYESYIFISQKKQVYSPRSLNRIIKNVFDNQHLNISTHSLRKSFGRQVYENNHQSEHSLILLSEIFCHSSVSITRKYLGLRKEEIENIYLGL
jgi:site-specific recombinase XerD